MPYKPSSRPNKRNLCSEYQMLKFCRSLTIVRDDGFAQPRFFPIHLILYQFGSKYLTHIAALTHKNQKKSVNNPQFINN